MRKIHNFLFNYFLFRIYIYHPAIFLYNLIRDKNGMLSVLKNVFFSSNSSYALFDFNINAPSKLDKYFFANINTHYNCFVIENYELSEKKLIEKYLEKEDVVLELGGCLGVISLVTNKIISNKKNHVVLEIDKMKFDFLKLNRDENKAKFQLLNAAISDKKNIYYQPSTNFWGGKITSNSKNKLIETFNLLDIEKKFNITFNTLIMDIEGGEIEIFKKQNLNKVKKVIFENHYTHDLKQNNYIKKIMGGIGFKKIECLNKVEVWLK